MATLHDQLQALAEAGKLSAEDIKGINDSVTSIKAKATDVSKSELEGIQTKLDEANSKLGVYTKAERANKIKALIKNTVPAGKEDKVLKYAGFTDDDDDEAVLAKAATVVEDFGLDKTEEKVSPEIKRSIGSIPVPKKTKEDTTRQDYRTKNL